MRAAGLLAVGLMGVGVEGQCNIGSILDNLDYYLPAPPVAIPAGTSVADGGTAEISLSEYACDGVSCTGTTLSPSQPTCAKGLMGFTLSLSLQEAESAVDKPTLLAAFNTMFNPDYEATNPQVISTTTSSSSARVDIAPNMQFQSPSQLKEAVRQKYTDTHQSPGGVSTVYTPTDDVVLEIIRSHNPCDPSAIHQSMEQSGHIDLSLSFVDCKSGEMVRPGGRFSCKTEASGYYCDVATCIGEVGADQWDPPNPKCNIVDETLQFEFFMKLDTPPDSARITSLTNTFNEVYGHKYSLLNGKPASADGNPEIRFDVVQSKADQSIDAMKKDIENLFVANSAKFGAVASTRVNAAPGMPLVRQPGGSLSTAAPDTPSPDADDDEFDWLPVILGIVGGLVCLILLFLAWRIRRMAKKKEEAAMRLHSELRVTRQREMSESIANSSAVSEPKHNFYKALDDFSIPAAGRSRSVQPPTPKPSPSSLSGGGGRDLSPFGRGLGRGHIVERGVA